jgi:alpha,alpha-trehalase
LISRICCLSQNVICITDYEDLFDTVQKSKLFADQKKFVDFTPKFNQSPSDILCKYHKEINNKSFDLRTFISNNFDTTFIDTSYILKHINYLWQYLSRIPESEQNNSTLIPLKYPYIVPGGRFREIYYWDSYFTMLGLEVAKETVLIKNMLDNFAYLINIYGHIPNGNRSYYLSRSQPPFFSLMIELYSDLPQTDKKKVYNEYRDVLAKEHDFWMKHSTKLTKEGNAKFRVVRLSKDCILNRYWDNLSIPRPEAYLYDIEIKNESSENDGIYRDIRAAAESGWDFSSRWFGDDNSITTIQTTNIIPIDLNCLLYHQEVVLSKMYDNTKSAYYENAAKKRKKKIIELFWNEKSNFFFDYDFTHNKNTSTYSLAALYPLFFNIVDTTIAHNVAIVIEQEFLKAGGLVTTLNKTGQQWDYPNGWPPMQWIGYKALKNYGFDTLANKIAERWINLNIKVFFETNKMMEKYDVVDINRKGGGGEYELQDGFGWTNGVFLKLWSEIHKENYIKK